MSVDLCSLCPSGQPPEFGTDVAGTLARALGSGVEELALLARDRALRGENPWAEDDSAAAATPNPDPGTRTRLTADFLAQQPLWS